MNDDGTSSQGNIVDAIRAGASPPEIANLLATHFVVGTQIENKDFMELRSSVGDAMDRVGFGTGEWDAFYAILNALDDNFARSLVSQGDDSPGYTETRSAYTIERILHRARVTNADGSKSYAPELIGQLVALADSKGMLAALGAKGEELRSLGSFTRVASFPKKDNGDYLADVLSRVSRLFKRRGKK